jgi:hypothetical protein
MKSSVNLKEDPEAEHDAFIVSSANRSPETSPARAKSTNPSLIREVRS